MCMALYIAADTPLPEIPQTSPPAPLSVEPIEEADQAVRVHFSKPYVYFVGSHTGCSCGFQYGPDAQDDLEGRESVRQFGAYLAEAVARAGPLELYACWSGDEAERETTRTTVSPGSFGGDMTAFALAERWFGQVVA